MTELAVIEPPILRWEKALTIAVALREAQHLGKSAALVTPDRALARRVMASLGAELVSVHDFGGDGLMETSPARYPGLRR